MVITSTDLPHNSSKAMKPIKNLSKDPTISTSPCLGNTNQVAHQLLINSRSTMPNKPKRPVLPTDATGEVTLLDTFFKEDYRKVIATLKYGKAAGIDDVLMEQLYNIGPTSHKWLLDMFNRYFTETRSQYCGDSQGSLPYFNMASTLRY